MTATNHALTGALIGLTINQPLIAIPLAFLSHYVLDAIPHADGFISIKSKKFRYYLLAEAGLCGLIVLTLFLSQPSYWWLAVLCAFVAASPDFMWINMFRAKQKGKNYRIPKNIFAQVHHHIQWFAKPIGAFVELAWAIGAISLLAIFLKKL